MEFADLMEAVAGRLPLGELNKKFSSKRELRYGTKGSLSIKLDKGTYYDHELEQGGGVLDLIKLYGHTDPVKWLRDQGLIVEDSNRHAFQIDAAFDYKDENGQLLFQVCRGPDKGFRQRRPNGKGWIWDIKGVRRVLYRLPELLAESGTIFVPEGEKHVDALRKLGLRATCNSQGAGKWKAEYQYEDCLRAADVVILPDNDKVGQDHATTIANALHGVAARVRVLNLPDLPPKGDVIDWLASGGTKDQLLVLADGTPDWAEKSAIEICWPGEHKDVEPRWRIKHRIAEVGTGLISGQWGTGKTFSALDLAHAVMSRKEWTGQRVVACCGVLYIAVERPYEIPLRLRGIGIDDKLPFAWLKSCPKLLTGRGTTDEESVDTLIKVSTIAARRMAQRYKVPLGLILIDTVSRAAAFPAGGENDPSQCQALMSALTVLSTETNTFVFGLDHMGKDVSKGTRGGSPKEDYADVVLSLVGRNRTGEMFVTKVSGGPAGFVIPFQLPIKTMGQDIDGDPITTCTVAWGDTTVPVTTKKKPKAEEALAVAIKAVGDLPASEEALQKAFYEAYPAGEKEASRSAWRRALKELRIVKLDDGTTGLDWKHSPI
jgi:AAA domain